MEAGCSNWPPETQSDPPRPEKLIRSSDEARSPRTPADMSGKATNLDVSEVTPEADLSRLEIRQDSCMSWTQAPNSTVCCDHSSGQWVETGVQRDDYTPGGPACAPEEGDIMVNGESVASSSMPVQAASSSSDSIVQQNYCNGAMQAPNSTVCCDMSSGLWVPSGLQRDTMSTDLVSAACPAGGEASINF